MNVLTFRNNGNLYEFGEIRNIGTVFAANDIISIKISEDYAV